MLMNGWWCTINSERIAEGTVTARRQCRPSRKASIWRKRRCCTGNRRWWSDDQANRLLSGNWSLSDQVVAITGNWSLSDQVVAITDDATDAAPTGIGMTFQKCSIVFSRISCNILEVYFLYAT